MPKPKPSISYRRNYTNNHKALFAHALANTTWDSVYRATTVQGKYDAFDTTIKALLDGFFPVRKISSYPSTKPWVTDRFKALISKRMMYLRDGNAPMYAFYRNIVNREAKRLRSQFYNAEVKHLLQSDQGKWWQNIRSFLGTDARPTSIAKSTNSNASEINCFFESVTAAMPPLEPLSDPAYASCSVPESFLLDTSQVERVLSQLNRRKSPGPDGVPSWILCDHADSLAAPATHIFNSTMIDGQLPTVWTRAEVVPIPKVHPPRSITTDLRPISLTPVLSKCFETFITKWLMDVIGPQLDPNQYGNVKGRPTQHALLRMLHEWTSSTDQAKAMLRILLVDFSKAFDLINHNLLIDKLEALDVPKALTRWIHAFLSDRQQRVRLQDDVSDWLRVNGGVPQGTKLGPVLFLVMINDLHVQLPTVKYVDDTTIFECLPRNAPSTLQPQADALSQWCDMNGCRINTKKTAELRIDFSKSPRDCPSISINNRDISVFSQAKLLGVVICDDLSWEANTSAICSKASQRLHYLVNLK